MIFGINATCDISYNNFEISLVVFMPNITTNHAITHTNKGDDCDNDDDDGSDGDKNEKEQ